MKLNIGCGKQILDSNEYINLDIKCFDGVDVVHDINKFPYPFEDNLFNEIICNDVLYVAKDIVKVMEELHRISKPNGLMLIRDVHYSCSGVHNAPDLVRAFGKHSFDWLDMNVKDEYSGTRTKKKFKILKKIQVPTRFGRLFPFFIRDTIGLILNEVFVRVEFVIKVIK